MGVTWSLFLFLFTTDSPKDHRFISDKEKHFILEETKKAINFRLMCQTVSK